MGVSDALWEIECSIEDAFERPERKVERQRAQSHRSVYEQTLVEVDQQAGSEAMYALSSWIRREIKTSKRLPASHEVRQIGTEICRRMTPPTVSPEL